MIPSFGFLGARSPGKDALRPDSGQRSWLGLTGHVNMLAALLGPAVGVTSRTAFLAAGACDARGSVWRLAAVLGGAPRGSGPCTDLERTGRSAGREASSVGAAAAAAAEDSCGEESATDVVEDVRLRSP